MRKSTPVLVVAGYLGAGKTTLLNHLLRNNNGLRIGVIVNDFGAINIDALLVAGQVDAMLSLSNGCICCEVDTGDISEMLGKLSNVTPRLDVIVVEASGVAEPGTLARLIAATEDPDFHYSGLVLVADAVAARDEDVARHVRVADLVLLNKTDQVAPERLGEWREIVASCNPAVPVLPTSFCRIDPEMLFDPVTQRRASALGEQLSFDELLRECAHEDHAHHHPHYQTIAWTAETPLHPRRFMAFLESRPHGLYRAKGLVDFGQFGGAYPYVLQLVGRSLRFERNRRDRGAPPTQLVFIGTDFDEHALKERLAACVVTPADGPDEYAILSVLRFADHESAPQDETITS
ncbi:GTP-binding protein [Hoyosella sp. YIM 151337]|uniref:CobW family GTP-binding protein n=1 Tax=Hoyosella sp. YIM 151337 TaxID=2992742 RepID=UPI002235F42A|nr:CobW family GTP-binding protein [Hoyosella sp. YIM 151337]MCW4355156.1 GTP-binding protein [Hoyosella sp. YIM 151337]